MCPLFVLTSSQNVLHLWETNVSQQNQQRGNGFALSRDLTPQLVPLASCKPFGREIHRHPPQQVRKLAESLNRFGFVLPILINPLQQVVAGWGLVLAAQQLDLSEVPAVSISDLSEAELRMLRLALNRISEESTWDYEVLALEFSEILDLDPQIELECSGFEIGELDAFLDDGGVSEEDELPQVKTEIPSVSRINDLWVLGQHRLLCGNALQSESYAQLLGSDKAAMMFSDPPYNLPVDGHVSGLGAVKHTEFIMASGELSSAEFATFLRTSLGHAQTWSIDGAIHFVCMDWRHLSEILAAGKPVAMIADAIRDCSNRGALILDPFGGAGTTIVAAERTGRSARVIEIDPLYVDVSVRRWQELTGDVARLERSGLPFSEIAKGRSAQAEIGKERYGIS